MKVDNMHRDLDIFQKLFRHYHKEFLFSDISSKI